MRPYLSLSRVDAHVGRGGGARVEGHVTGGGSAVPVDVRQLAGRAETWGEGNGKKGKGHNQGDFTKAAKQPRPGGVDRWVRYRKLLIIEKKYSGEASKT